MYDEKPQLSIPAEVNTLGKPKHRLTSRHKKALAVAGVFILLAAGAAYFKSLVIAATVDGKLISRMSVIKELEKQGGAEALDAQITEKLILNEGEQQGVEVPQNEIDDELNKLKAGVEEMGGTFEDALAERGFTEESLRHSITIQLLLQKLLVDITTVSDEEVEQYIAENEEGLPEGDPEQMRNVIRRSLQDQKFSQEAPGYIAKLKAEANIKYFVNY